MFSVYIMQVIYVTFVREVVRPSHYVDVVVALLQMWTVCTVSCSFRAEIWISKEPTVILDSCICEQHAGQQRANATQVTICPIDTVAECWMWLLFFFSQHDNCFLFLHTCCLLSGGMSQPVPANYISGKFCSYLTADLFSSWSKAPVFDMLGMRLNNRLSALNLEKLSPWAWLETYKPGGTFYFYTDGSTNSQNSTCPVMLVTSWCLKLSVVSKISK